MNSPRILTTDRQGRRQDLDLIRAAVVGGLIFYHTALIFGPVDFYVNNRPPSFPMTLFVFFAALFGMPLLFVVAGAGAWHSLRRRTAGGFVRERLSRLLVVGVVLVVPPQVYYALRAENESPGSYWPLLAQFFDVRLDLAFPSIVQRTNPDGLFTVAHLWFLFYLLIYSLLLLPVFLGLRREGRKRLVEWLTAHCCGPSAILLLALPVVLIETSLGTWGPGGWNSYSCGPFLLYGFLMAADARLDAALRGLWREATLIGLATLLGLFLITHYDLGGADPVLGTDYDPWSVLWRLLKAVGGWSWTVAMLGLGDFLVRHLPRRARGRPPAQGTAVLPAMPRRRCCPSMSCTRPRS